MTELRALLADGPVNVESLILLEARPCAGESDAQIIAGAWDFARINGRYAKHQEILARHPQGPVNNEARAKAFHRTIHCCRVPCCRTATPVVKPGESA